jgi:hypothetical protein
MRHLETEFGMKTMRKDGRKHARVFDQKQLLAIAAGAVPLAQYICLRCQFDHAPLPPPARLIRLQSPGKTDNAQRDEREGVSARYMNRKLHWPRRLRQTAYRHSPGQCFIRNSLIASQSFKG